MTRVLFIDDANAGGSPDGSWERHLRHIAPMRAAPEHALQSALQDDSHWLGVGDGKDGIVRNHAHGDTNA